MFGLLATIYADFLAASAIEQIGFISALLGLASVPSFFAARLNYRSLASKLATARDEAQNLRSELAKEQSARKRAEDQLDRMSTSFWMRSAQRERKSGNEELAIRAIEEGFEHWRGPMGDLTIALASHHLSLVLSSDYATHLEAGRRFATLAHHLMPDDRDAATLLQEAQHDILTTEDAAKFEQFDGAEVRDVNLAREYVGLIVSEADRLIYNDKPRLALRVLRRAEFIVCRAKLSQQLLLGVSISELNALLLCGEHIMAVQKATELSDRAAEIGEAGLWLRVQALIAKAIAEERSGARMDAAQTLTTLMTLNWQALDEQTQSSIWIQAASLVGAAGRRDEAVAFAQKGLQIAQDGEMRAFHRFEFLQRFGVLMVDLGSFEEARKAINWMRPFERDSDFEKLAYATRRFLEWRLAEASGDINTAVEIARDLLGRYEAGHGVDSGGAKSMRAFLAAHDG